MTPFSPEPGAPESGLVWPPLEAGPQLLWMHSQANMVSGPLAVRSGHSRCGFFGLQGKPSMWLAAKPSPAVADTLLCAGAK